MAGYEFTDIGGGSLAYKTPDAMKTDIEANHNDPSNHLMIFAMAGGTGTDGRVVYNVVWGEQS